VIPGITYDRNHGDEALQAALNSAGVILLGLSASGRCTSSPAYVNGTTPTASGMFRMTA
jgi:hypothetical protein